jgi:hypothetical protein
MLTTILTHTPLWVWGIFAFLLYRGILASQDRNLNISRIYILPLVMLALAVQGMAHGFADADWLPIWGSAVLLSAALAYRLTPTDSIQVLPEPDMLRERGSWVPMIIMMAIFVTKYVVGASLGLHPELADNTVFVAIVCALYGTFNGMYLGKMLATLALYRRYSAQMQIA